MTSPQNASPAASLKTAIEKAITGAISELDKISLPLPPRLLASVIRDYVPESTEPEAYVPKVVELLNAPEETESRIQTGGLDVQPFGGTLAEWIVERAKIIDNATGDLSVISRLLSEAADDEAVAKYQNGPFTSLEILVYEFQCDWRLEDLDPGKRVDAVRKVLEETDVETALERILPGILQDDKELWASVWDWMKEKGWGAVSPVLRDWAGPPKDLRRDYVRAGLDIAYTGKDIENEVWDVYEILRAVGNQFSSILQTTIPPDMIESSNPDEETKELFLEPSGFAMKAFYTLVTAAEQLGISVGQALDYRVEASKEKQGFLFENILKGGNWASKSEGEVESHVHDARALRDYAKVFGRLDRDYFEDSIFEGLLKAGKYVTAKRLYLTTAEKPIPLQKVEKIVLEDFYSNYDQASNGNKTRGKMKAAAQAIGLLDVISNPSDAIIQARELLSATHSLSQYSLVLQPSVLFTPRDLRHYPEPLDLIPHALSQNQGLYAQPDALIPIFTALLFGVGKPPTNLDLASFTLQQAILTAISLDDFQTAYSLIQRQAVPPSTADLKPLGDDNKLWTSILQAARHRPAADPMLNSIELGKRMELAAITLATAPEDALGDILGVWRRLEEELLITEDTEQQEEEGAYAGYEGAKNQMRMPGQVSGDGRRKRDIVSSAVTSGLVSGIGWMIGAQPRR